MISTKKISSLTVGGIVFLLCAYYIGFHFQWHDIIPILVRLNLILFFAAGGATILIYWMLRTMRWSVLLQAANVHLDFRRLYLAGAVCMALSIMTPFQSGEALKVEMLKKMTTIDSGSGYGIFMTERILDLLVVLMMALIGLVFVLSHVANYNLMLFAAIGLLICVIGFPVVIHYIHPSNVLDRLFAPLKHCLTTPGILVISLLLTAGAWFLIVFGWYVSLLSVPVVVTLPEVTALTSVTTIIGVISFIPGALGISEVSIATFLLYLGCDAATSQAGALAIRLYGLLIIALGLVHLAIWKLVRRRF